MHRQLRYHRFQASLTRLFIVYCLLLGGYAAAQETKAPITFTLTDIVLVASFDSFGEQLSFNELRAYAQQLQKQQTSAINYDGLLAITDALTQFMRERGYKFHYAHLGEQGIRDGVVTINIRTVTLSDVQIDNQGPVSDSLIQSKFSALIGKPLFQPDIDRILRQLHNAEEIKAFAYYSRGSYQDSVRLNIKLADVANLRGSVLLDNYGSPETGKERVLGQVHWLSPTGRLDRLSAGIMAAPTDEKINTYGFLRYSSPLSDPAKRINLSISNNIFAVGNEFAALELNGDARVYGLSFSHDFRRNWQGKQQWQLGYEQKETDFESLFNDPSIEQDQQVKSLQLQWFSQHQFTHAYQHIGLAYSAGKYSIDGYIEDEDFSKLSANYHLSWNTFKSSRFNSNFRLALRGQYADQAISPFDQVALGGAWAARGVEAGSFSADRAVINSLEWHLPKLISGNATHYVRLSPFLFTDYANGERLDEHGKVLDSATFISTGLGLSTYIGQHAQLKLQAAQNRRAELESGVSIEEAGLLAELEYLWP